VNPVAAFLSGPYASTGDDAEALAGYNPLNGPLLASAGAASTYAGGSEQALENRLAAMPDPSLAASIAAVNGSLPQGTVTVEPLQIIEEGGRYGNAAQQREANFEAINSYLDSVSVDPADIARVNAARAQQYATDVANQRVFEAWQAQDQKDLLIFYPKVIAGGVESLVNSVAALPQQIWNGMKMYGAADLDDAAASASLAGNNTASVQLSDAADATRAAALQPAWVPFQNLSPEEQFGGDVAMVAGLFTGYGEAEIGSVGEFGIFARGTGALDDVDVVPLADGGIPVANGVRYGPLSGPGPLGDVAKDFRSGSYTQEVLQSDTTFYRVFGGDAGPVAGYWTDVYPAGPLQSIEDSVLNPAWGNTAKYVSTIRAPAGTTVYRGFASPQPLPGGGSLIGGGSQIYIPNVNPNWLISGGR